MSSHLLRIASFSLDALNGVFDYRDCFASGSLDDLIILYGDNGSGKTTILHLIFHLLSAESGRGHLTGVSRVPFKSLRVQLSDGTTVAAERQGDVKSFPISFCVTRPNAKRVEYQFVPEGMRERVFQERLERALVRNVPKARKDKTAREGKHVTYSASWFVPGHSAVLKHSDDDSHKAYLNALRELNITCYFMATDRHMRSDSIEERRPEQRTVGDPERRDDIITRVRAQYLKDALNSASRYLNRQIIRASNAGSKNTNDIYAELIAQIANEHSKTDSVGLPNGLHNAFDQLLDLEKQNKRLSDLGIAPALDFENINQAVANAHEETKPLLDKILRPYIDSLEARLLAFNPVGDVIETFLGILNGLFRHKSVAFSPTNGFTIHGIRQEDLSVQQLSSGEQQLLLMFCYLLVSNEQPSIFMIDEPEISLNVKWQRDLIHAMRKITNESQTQIVIATHSIELLTQYSEMVIQLDPTRTNQSPSFDGTTPEAD